MRCGRHAMLGAGDYRAGLALVRELAEATLQADAFARSGVQMLARFVSSDVTTLSVCDLVSGRREVVGTPERAISAADRSCFDRHFDEHPLVRYHALRRGGDTHRISDSVPFARFRETALYNDYYRRVGLDHAMAVPLHVDQRLLVSFVLNRRRRDFSDRDRERLEMLRPNLGVLYHQSNWLQQARRALRTNARQWLPRYPSRRGELTVDARWRLTPREREILLWLARGKSDRDIAALLAISPRTVHKHLQHLYDKLGVENRTAAVMRAVGARAV